MKNIYSFVCLSTVKRKALWISMGIFWLFLFLILIIVPGILNYDPLFIWNNPIMDIPSYTLIIVAICCSIIAVYVFREHHDDGTELITVSKPIERWKILIAKLLVFLTLIVAMTIGGLLLFICTFAFGQKNNHHINGVDFNNLGATIASFCFGCIICSLFFGAIAILISLISGKVTILIGTIGLSLVINVLYLIMPIMATDINDYVGNKYGNGFNSVYYFSAKDYKQHTGVTMNFINDNGYDLKYYSEDANKHNHNDLASYFNISQQISTLYKIFGSTNNDTYSNSAYGEYFNRKYTIEYEHKVIDDEPVMWPEISTNQDTATIYYRVFGNNLSNYTNLAFSLLGMPSTTLLYFRPTQGSLISSAASIVYFTSDELTTHNVGHQPIKISIDTKGTGSEFYSDPEKVNNWDFIFDGDQNGELTKWYRYINNAFHIDKIPTDNNGTPIRNYENWENDAKYKRPLFGKIDDGMLIDNYFGQMIRFNVPNHPEWTTVLPDFPISVDEMPMHSLAYALLGREIRWENDSEATFDMNLCRCQFEWLKIMVKSLIFQKIWHDSGFITNPQEYNDEDALKFTLNTYNFTNDYEASFCLFDASKSLDSDSQYVYYIYNNDQITTSLKYKLFRTGNVIDHSNCINNMARYHSSPYISNINAVIFWTCFGIVLFTVAFVFYSRVDFK